MDAAAGGGGLERSPSNVSKRSNSGAVRIGSSAAASAASSPGAVAQQVSVVTTKNRSWVRVSVRVFHRITGAVGVGSASGASNKLNAEVHITVTFER